MRRAKRYVPYDPMDRQRGHVRPWSQHFFSADSVGRAFVVARPVAGGGGGAAPPRVALSGVRPPRNRCWTSIGRTSAPTISAYSPSEYLAKIRIQLPSDQSSARNLTERLLARASLFLSLFASPCISSSQSPQSAQRPAKVYQRRDLSNGSGPLVLYRSILSHHTARQLSPSVRYGGDPQWALLRPHQP